MKAIWSRLRTPMPTGDSSPARWTFRSPLSPEVANPSKSDTSKITATNGATGGTTSTEESPLPIDVTTDAAELLVRTGETTQQVPDEFRVAEGGQETL